MDTHWNVFISSTSIDLPEYREAVRDALLSNGFFPSGMEHWPVGGENPVDLCRGKVEAAHFFVGVYAHRYGWRPVPGGPSIAEMEYDWACERGIPCLCFIMRDDHPWPKDKMELDAEADLKRFKTKVSSNQVGFFTTPDDLKAQVTTALTALLPRTNFLPSGSNVPFSVAKPLKSDTVANEDRVHDSLIQQPVEGSREGGLPVGFWPRPCLKRWICFLLCLAAFLVAALLLPLLGRGGDQITFISDRGGNFDIYSMDSSGGNIQNLTNNAADDKEFTWSPDGRRLAFVSNRNGNYEIYIRDDNETEVRNITRNSANDYHPAWSPTGDEIAFVSERDGNAEIYVVDTGGANLRNLTNSNAADYHPTWSPDGKWIAFTREQDGGFDIYLMDAQGNNVQPLTNDPARDQLPDFSPDGLSIAFMSERDGDAEIYVMDSEGLNVRRLTNNSAWDDSPKWSPSGDQILFATDRDGNIEVYVMDAFGDDPRRLTNNDATDTGADWRPSR